MLPPDVEQLDGVEQRPSSNGLLAGDLGVIVLGALLDAGVGYIASAWHDRPTPIDAAIADARERVLTSRGVVLRRLRSLTALEGMVRTSSGGVAGGAPRGAVVFGGRRGVRPTLERFCALESGSAVIGFCFDEDALAIEGAIVIDPAPSASGLAAAITQGLEASNRAGRPALVVLRQRMLGIRGTVRSAGEPLTAARAAELDAEQRRTIGGDDASGDERDRIASAICAAGLVEATIGPAANVVGPQLAIWGTGPVRVSLERALAELAGELDEVDAVLAAQLRATTVVASRAVGVVLDEATGAGRLIADADELLVIGRRAERVGDHLRAASARLGHAGMVRSEQVDAVTLRGEQLVGILASWIGTLIDEGVLPASDEARAAVASRVAAPQRMHRVADEIGATRIPGRTDKLHRSIPPEVAAGLVLAQGVIGVPGRIDPQWPTYRTDSGAFLTVAPGAVFAEHGAATAAPQSGAGVMVVIGNVPGVMEAAGAIGATVELVDGGSPRAIGHAIAKACSVGGNGMWRVLVVGEVQRIAAPRTASFGMDPDLVGTERLAVAAVPTAATVLVDMGEELVDGPVVLALDVPQSQAHLQQVRELSPATWDLTRHAPGGGRRARAAWNARRRAVRLAAGVDL